MKIAAVVILYNPDQDVAVNILSYHDYTERVYVLDNTEKQKEEIKTNLSSFEKAIYIQDGENKGIANRLNQACRLAISEGFEWLLTMDQDSSFKKEDLLAYLSCIKSVSESEKIAMTGVRFVGLKEKSLTCGYKEVTSLITSGSIINLKLIEEIGDFDEALFIDLVDIEFCFRSILKGFKIVQFENIFLNHSLGKSSVHKSLKNFKNTVRSLHSPSRIFYMARNYLYIEKKYKNDFEEEVYVLKKDLLNRIKNNLLYNKKRFSVLKFFLSGIINYKRNNMGKLFD